MSVWLGSDMGWLRPDMGWLRQMLVLENLSQPPPYWGQLLHTSCEEILFYFDNCFSFDCLHLSSTFFSFFSPHSRVFVDFVAEAEWSLSAPPLTSFYQLIYRTRYFTQIPLQTKFID